LAKAGGIDAQRLVDALAGAGADSRVRAAFGSQIAAGTFVPSLNLVKDIAAVIAHASSEEKSALLAETARVIKTLRER
jgi:3-hydroxyisobutyrate dehydrogenase-like beta-hydroxyacid dehydrogenase